MSNILALSPIILLCASFVVANGEAACERTDGKTLLKGCAILKGASVVSQGGTVVNDSNCDVLLPKLIFAKEPNVFFNKADANKAYMVVIVDPDAPNHTAGNFYLHMIRSNVPGDNIIKGDLSTSLIIKEYAGPTPPVSTGSHRYLFLIYEQSGKDMKPVAPKERTKFNLNEWIEKANVCGPVAGVQFRARFDL